MALLNIVIYRNNLKNRFLAASALPQNFDSHSRLALRQWSLAPNQNSEEPPCQIPDSSGYFGIPNILSSKMMPIYYQRDLGRAIAVENELIAIGVLMQDAFSIAREVTRLLPERSDKLQEPDVHFHVNGLFLQHILRENASGISKQLPIELSAKNITHLNQFLQAADFSSISFHNPYAADEAQEQATLEATAEPLQHVYFTFTKRFIREEVPPLIQGLSCFDYVLYKAGLHKKFLRFKQLEIILNPDKWQYTALDYIGFLKIQGLVKAMLPLQPNDIILYFDPDGEWQHAAYVAQNTQRVYAKFGNKNPFAYFHYEIETPSLYGTQFQIYRK